MRFRSAVKCVAVALALLAATSCNRQDSDGFVKSAGGNVHHNDKFGLTVTSPEGWYVMDFDQTAKMMDAGVDVAAGDNDQLKSVAQAAKQNTNTIFSFFRLPPGSPVDFNPSVLGAAENVGAAPGVETGTDYFFHAKKLMAQSNVPYEFEDSFKTRRIGGHVFDQMDLHVTVADQRIGQSYYAARHGPSIVLIIQSYKTDADRKDADAIVDSIKLDW